MQTLIRRADNVSLYLIPDSTTVDMTGTDTIVTGPSGPLFKIGDHTTARLRLYTGVTTGGGDDSRVLRGTSIKARAAKEGESGSFWVGGGYTYDGSAWAAV